MFFALPTDRFANKSETLFFLERFISPQSYPRIAAGRHFLFSHSHGQPRIGLQTNRKRCLFSSDLFSLNPIHGQPRVGFLISHSHGQPRIGLGKIEKIESIGFLRRFIFSQSYPRIAPAIFQIFHFPIFIFLTVPSVVVRSGRPMYDLCSMIYDP